jgi:hypothetical protein
VLVNSPASKALGTYLAGPTRLPGKRFRDAPNSLGLSTTPYQPIDTIADCKERKSGSSDRTWSTMKIVPGAIVMPSLMITVMPSVIVMG